MSRSRHYFALLWTIDRLFGYNFHPATDRTCSGLLDGWTEAH